MEPVKIILRREETIKLFLDYYGREFWESVRRIPFLWIVMVISILLFTGYFMHYSFVTGIVLYGIAVTVIFLSFCFIRYFIAMRSLRKSITKQMPEISRFDLWFDEEGIFSLENEVESKVGWNEYEFYRQLEGIVYLFRNNREVQSIFTDKIMGKEAFNDFAAIVGRKVKNKVPLNAQASMNANPDLLDEGL